FFQAEDGIRDRTVTGVQTCALPIFGEDRIDHTPKDETVKLKIGNAFDVVCERKQTDFQRYQLAANTWEMEYEITLRNHKPTPVKIGRASCRERVEISGGAGSLERKE